MCKTKSDTVDSGNCKSPTPFDRIINRLHVSLLWFKNVYEFCKFKRKNRFLNIWSQNTIIHLNNLKRNLKYLPKLNKQPKTAEAL